VANREKWRIIDPPKPNGTTAKVIEKAATPATQSLVGPVAAVFSALMIVALVGGVVSARQEANASQVKVESLQAQNTALQEELRKTKNELAANSNNKICDDGTVQIAQVREFLAKGQFSTVANLAEAALIQRDTPLCAEARMVTASLWYDASLRAILATPRPSWADPQLQQKLATDWQSLEQKADGYQVPQEKRWDRASIITVATNSNLWGLADTVFRAMWQQGKVGVEAVPLRFSLLRNQGRDLAFNGSPNTREQGMRVLATAHAIAKAYNLGRGEACDDLHQLGYADCDKVVPDSSDPVLTAAPKNKEY
jgi:hypothetical protein